MDWMFTPIPFSSSSDDSSCWPSESHFQGQMGGPSGKSENQIHCSDTEPTDETTEPPVLTTLRSWKGPTELKSQQRQSSAAYDVKRVSGGPCARNNAKTFPQKVFNEIRQATPVERGSPHDGFFENTMAKQECSILDSYSHLEHLCDSQQTQTSSISVHEDFGTSNTNMALHSRQDKSNSLTETGSGKLGQLDETAICGIPQMFKAITAPRCPQLSSRGRTESSFSVTPFHIFGFPPHAPKAINECRVSETEWPFQTTSTASQQSHGNAHSHYSSSTEMQRNFQPANAANFLTQPCLAPRQNHCGTIQMQNADVQHLLITQTMKRRQHRSTSIRIIEYNDIEHCPYQQGVTQNDKPLPLPMHPLDSTTDRDYAQQLTTPFDSLPNASATQYKQSPSPTPIPPNEKLSTSTWAAGSPDSFMDSAPTQSRILQEAQHTGKSSVKVKNEYIIPENLLPYPTEDAYFGRPGYGMGAPPLPVGQNSSFSLSHSSLLCSPMPGTSSSIQHGGYTAGSIASNWRENCSRHGYPCNACGMMEIQSSWRGNVGPHTQEYNPATAIEEYSINNNVSLPCVRTHEDLWGLKPQTSIASKVGKQSVRSKSKLQKNRRFVCPHLNCSKKYFKQAHLEMHLRKHAGERPYSCKFQGCGRSFQRSDQLKRHGRRHTGEKPYHCHECGRAFARSDHLKTHRKTHADKPYFCRWENCKKKFARPDELCRHQMSHKSTNMTGYLKEQSLVSSTFRSTQLQQCDANATRSSNLDDSLSADIH